MRNGFLNWWSGGVVGDILFGKLNSFLIFTNGVHCSPFKVEFVMPNVFLNWWSGGVVGDVMFEKLNSFSIFTNGVQLSPLESFVGGVYDA